MEITEELNILLFDKFNVFVAQIAKGIFERMEDCTEDEIEDELQYAMDDELIYDEDLWEIMKHYQLPQDANFDEAIEEFYNDLLDILYKVNA